MTRRHRRVVAFDLGGVVVDVNKQVLAPLGPPDVVERAFFVDGRHDRLTVGELSGEAFIALAARDLGLRDDVVRAAWASMVSFSAGGLALVADVAAVAAIAVWSNTDPVHWSVLGDGLVPHAVDIATSFSIGAMKPQPLYFARALARLDHRDDDVVFVDDRAENVAAARAAGVEAYRVDGVFETRSLLRSLGLSLLP